MIMRIVLIWLQILISMMRSKNPEVKWIYLTDRSKGIMVFIIVKVIRIFD